MSQHDRGDLTRADSEIRSAPARHKKQAAKEI
jgi:hypothetical protein